MMGEDSPSITSDDTNNAIVIDQQQKEELLKNIPSTSSPNLDTSSDAVEDKDSRDDFLDSLIDAELNDSLVMEKRNNLEETIVEDNLALVCDDINDVCPVDVNETSDINDVDTSTVSVDANDTDMIDGHHTEELPDSIPDDSKFVKPRDVLCHFPLGRIKRIVKADLEVPVISAESLFLISKSTELFLRWLGKEVHSYTIQQKKKTIQLRDLNQAIYEHPALGFLDGALD